MSVLFGHDGNHAILLPSVSSPSPVRFSVNVASVESPYTSIKGIGKGIRPTQKEYIYLQTAHWNSYTV